MLLFVFVGSAAAQSSKKTVKYAVPRTAAIVSEANVPETPKPAEQRTEVAAPSGSAYQTSLQDLVTLRESELTAAIAQKAKMDELARDGLISRKALDEAADGIVEARAKLEDAKMRLASINAYQAPIDEDVAVQSDPEPAPEVKDTAAKPLIKKTSVIYPRGKKPSARRKTQ